MSVQILVVDDHDIVRRGIRRIVLESEFAVAAEAESAEQAQLMLNQGVFQLVLLDVVLPDASGFAFFERARNGTPIPTLFLAENENPTHVAKAVALGAAGLVLKSASRDALLSAMRSAVAGRSIWCREEMRRVTGALAVPRLDAEVEIPLTQREFEVLAKMCRGLTNKHIANELTISYETVKEHVQHILRKIGVADRTQAAVWAVRKGLVWPETEELAPSQT